MKRSEELTAKLGRSLQLTKDAAAEHPPTTPKASPRRTRESDGDGEAKLSGRKTKAVKKEMAEPMTVSLYPSDVRKADEIVIYMLQRGKRISRSDAVKLSLRSVQIGPALEAAHQELRAQDGRGAKQDIG